MRTFIMASIAAAGLIGLAAPVEAVPTGPRHLSVAAPPITQVRHRCGTGFHRHNGWQDKQGAWHGTCVPNHPKKKSSS
jgi:hypothetical protein